MRLPGREVPQVALMLVFGGRGQRPEINSLRIVTDHCADVVLPRRCDGRDLRSPLQDVRPFAGRVPMQLAVM